MAIQADGKIVAAGTTSVGDNPKNFALARYHGGDGSPDGDFGDAGTVVTDFGGTEEAWGIALQRDGKIVAAGSSCGNGCDFALARYRSDGSVDTSFSGDGKVLTDFVGLDDVAYAVAIQPDDGKIVAIGYAHTFGVITSFALARYDTGSTDATPPLIAGTVSPDPNSNGWHHGDVTLTWSVTDPESGIASSTCQGPFTLSAETNGSIVHCTARNGAGLSASWSSVPIRIDRTAPRIECGTADGAWHADNVSIACTANDERSGLATPPRRASRWQRAWPRAARMRTPPPVRAPSATRPATVRLPVRSAVTRSTARRPRWWCSRTKS